MRPLVVLDLCAGSGSATAAFRAHGHTVITVDNDPKRGPDVLCDIREYVPPPRADVIWASPPCVEFSRWAQPGIFPRGTPPSTTLVEACMCVVQQCQPVVWWLENVRGATEFLNPMYGRYLCHIGSLYLWSNSLWIPQAPPHFKFTYHTRSPRKRAMLPYHISEAVYAATIAQLGSFLATIAPMMVPISRFSVSGTAPR